MIHDMVCNTILSRLFLLQSRETFRNVKRRKHFLLESLAPGVGERLGSRGDRGERVVGVGLPGGHTVEYSDVLVLDSSAGGEVNGD